MGLHNDWASAYGDVSYAEEIAVKTVVVVVFPGAAVESKNLHIPHRRRVTPAGERCSLTSSPASGPARLQAQPSRERETRFVALSLISIVLCHA